MFAKISIDIIYNMLLKISRVIPLGTLVGELVVFNSVSRIGFKVGIKWENYVAHFTLYKLVYN